MLNSGSEDSQGKIYRPYYARLKASLAFTFESRRWYNKSEKEVTWLSRLVIKITSFIASFVDRYAKEKFDFVVAGNDPLVSLLISVKLSGKGYRVLIYPSYPDKESSELNELIESQGLLRNNNFVNNVSLLMGINKSFSNLHELLSYLSSIASKIKDEKGNSKVMISNGTKILIGNHWTLTTNNEQQICPMGNQVLETNSVWLLIRQYLTKYSPYESAPGCDKNRAPNYCITTTDNLILTTRTDMGISSELKAAKVIEFGDAKFNIEHHKTYSINDRVNEIKLVITWLNSIKTKEK